MIRDIILNEIRVKSNCFFKTVRKVNNDSGE